jgi:two-component system, LytTR family, response regulator AlgR
MRILVADDELPARQRLTELLGEIDPSCEVLTAGDGLSALALARQQMPQVALLDIRMPGMDGIDLAMRLSELAQPPAVVFVTAYDEHALAAFDANAIAYLLKPIRAQRLREALHKAQLFSRAQRQALTEAGGEASLSATLGGRLMRIPLSQVLYLRADQKYVEVCHEGGLALLDESLKSIEERFPDAFLRVHRNALVAPQRMCELLRAADGSVLLTLQDCAQRIEVSRRHLPEVRRRLRSGRT